MTGAREYGRALFMLALELGALEEIKNDAYAVKMALDANPEYKDLLDTPAISKEEKLSLADKAFGGLHFSVSNLVKILSEKHSVRAFSEIYTAYLALYNEHLGIEEVEAVTAVAMTESQIEALKAKLIAETGKKIIIKNTVDPTILGGVKLRYSGKQIDGSVKTRLDAFSESLKNIIV